MLADIRFSSGFRCPRRWLDRVDAALRDALDDTRRRLSKRKTDWLMTWDIGRKCLFCHVSAAPQTRRHRQRWMRDVRSLPASVYQFNGGGNAFSAVPSRFFHLPHIAGSPFLSMASFCLPGELLISFHGDNPPRAFVHSQATATIFNRSLFTR